MPEFTTKSPQTPVKFDKNDEILMSNDERMPKLESTNGSGAARVAQTPPPRDAFAAANKSAVSRASKPASCTGSYPCRFGNRRYSRFGNLRYGDWVTTVTWLQRTSYVTLVTFLTNH